MSYIKLDSYWRTPVPGGVQLSSTSLTMKLSDELTVEITAPILPLGNDLAITPVFENDGEHAVRMRLDRWSPMRLNPTRCFPINFAGQELAVRVARAFDADPATRWDCTAEEAVAWYRTWSADNTPTAKTENAAG